MLVKRWYGLEEIGKEWRNRDIIERQKQWEKEAEQDRGRALRIEPPGHGRGRDGREGPEHERERGGPEIGM